LKNSILIILLCSYLISCTKEVNIDIPGYKAELVVDGNIETDGYPVILLSKSVNVYAESYAESYIESFVADAEVKIVVNGDTTLLEYRLLNEFPESTQKKIAEMLRIEFDEVQQLPIKIYSSFTLKGEVGKNYELIILFKGKTYTAVTSILQPTTLNSLQWVLEDGSDEYGLIKAKLTDPIGQFDAYKYDSRRINTLANGKPLDYTYRNGNGGGRIFRDRYFDGLTIDLTFKNPQKKKDSTINDDFKRYFRRGDSVLVKLSKLDVNTYDFFRLKREQLENSGNPFATPINAKTNISGGALGIWAGFSPAYHVVYCME
jgi:hypothetical protein